MNNIGDVRVKVLYIGGSGRCGSTLLSLLFSELQDFIDCGEIVNIWQRGFNENRLCACGAPFSDCAYWSLVANNFNEHNRLDSNYIGQLVSQSVRYRNYFSLRNANRNNSSKGYEDVIECISNLYLSISTIARGKIIVDSSKLATYSRLLKLLPNVDLFYINLVRDPRAVVYSWGKKIKYDPNGAKEMDRFGAVHAALTWKAAYWTAEDTLKDIQGTTIRYEDLVSDTRNVFSKLMVDVNSWAGNKLAIDAFNDLSWSTVSHSLSGNPLRFRRGEGIKLDDAWKKSFKGLSRSATEIICLPEIIKYGYLHSA